MTPTAETKPHPIYLAGRWVESPDVVVIANPARPDEPAGRTYNATSEQYEEAVTVAVAAFEKTRKLPAYERSAALRKIADGIEARREEIGRLISTESGKPIRDALTEVDRGVLTFRIGAEEAGRIGGEGIPLDLKPASRGRLGVARRLPHARPGHRPGGSHRPEAAVTGSADNAYRGRGDRRSGPAGGLGQHPADDPRTGRPPGDRRAVQAAQLHRQSRGRLEHEGASGQEEGSARAGRQRRRHSRSVGQYRLGGAALRPGCVQLLGSGLDR